MCETLSPFPLSSFIFLIACWRKWGREAGEERKGGGLHDVEGENVGIACEGKRKRGQETGRVSGRRVGKGMIGRFTAKHGEVWVDNGGNA